MIRGFTYRVEVWVSPDRLERTTDDRRSLAQMLKDEIQSNLEDLRGVFQAQVARTKTKTKGRKSR